MSAAGGIIPYELGATVLKVQGVSLTLGGNLILRDVNLEIRDIRSPGRTAGQVVALLGPSGMGKTQLFRILAGLSEPDTGTVLLGEKAEAVEPGMVGVVAQDYPLFAHRRVLGNLLVAGKRAGLSGAEARKKAEGLLARFRLEDTTDKFPAQLSGGQRQRVAIAQQFMCSEHFLLLDEPFSGLDVLQLTKAVELILEMAGAHEMNTIIVVTHDITSGLEVADTVWLLGRDRDANGQPVPGARIQATYNLLDLGLAWRRNITTTPEFVALQQQIIDRFATL